jgi:hypothetical protein
MKSDSLNEYKHRRDNGRREPLALNLVLGGCGKTGWMAPRVSGGHPLRGDHRVGTR